MNKHLLPVLALLFAVIAAPAYSTVAQAEPAVAEQESVRYLFLVTDTTGHRVTQGLVQLVTVDGVLHAEPLSRSGNPVIFELAAGDTVVDLYIFSPDHCFYEVHSYALDSRMNFIDDLQPPCMP